MNKIAVILTAAAFPIFFMETGHTAVSSSASRIVLTDSRQNANSMAKVSVRVDLADSSGTPESGKSVTLQSSQPGLTFIQPAATDLNGSATGYIFSSSPLDADIWGLVDGTKILPNLIANRSAERGSAQPEVWTQYANQSIVPADHQYPWHVGTGSNTQKSLGLYMSAGNYQKYELSWLQIVNHSDLVAGTTYSLTALARASTDYIANGVPAGVYITATNQNSVGGPVTSSRTYVSSLSTEWRQLQVPSVQFPSNATRLEIGLDLVRSSGTVYFDDARLFLTPSVRFSIDRTSPSQINQASPTLLSAVPGEANGSIRVSWKSVGNDGMLWSNSNGGYDVRITEDLTGIPVSSWTLVQTTFKPASPGVQESFVIAGLTPGNTYQIAIRAYDQDGNRPEYGLTSPVFSRSGVAPITVLEIDQMKISGNFGVTPTFSGVTQAGAGLSVRIDGIVNGTTYADYSGKWRFQVSAPLSEGSHIAAFQAFDGNGNKSQAQELVFQVGSASSADEISNAFPNPGRFSSGKKMSVQVSLTSAKQINLSLYDLRGVKVAVLADGEFNLGQHTITWDGKDSSGNPLASNTYTLVLESAGSKSTRQITVLR